MWKQISEELKWIQLMYNQAHILTLVKKLIIKILNLKLVIILEYQNIRIFLQKVTLQIGLKRFLWLKKLRILCRGHMLLMVLMKKKLMERFTKTNCKKQVKKVPNWKSNQEKKVTNYMLKRKVMIIRLIVG